MPSTIRTTICSVLAAALLCLAPSVGQCYELPDARITPGAVNTQVDQADIRTTICVKGWTRGVRPPVSYTNRIKRLQMRRYGVSGESPRDFELDHLIPLELGGSPDDPANLWPQPRSGRWNAALKDDLERNLNRRVCSGRLPLADAQKAIRTDWTAAYRQYMGPRAAGHRAAAANR